MSHVIQQALRYPFQGSVLAAMIAYVLLDALAATAGLFGVALRWFVNVGALAYCYTIFRAAAHGRRSVPAMNADHANIFASPTVVSVILLLLASGAIHLNATQHLSSSGAWLVDAAMALVLPASLSLVMLNQTLLDALNPKTIVQTMIALGPPYLLMPGAALCASIVHGVMSRVHLPWFVSDLLGAYLALATICVWGFVLFTHRDRIGLEKVSEDTVREQLIERQEDKDRKAQMDIAFTESRTDSARALAAIELLFAGDNDTLAQREWAFDYAREWPNEMVPLRLAQQLIERHLTLGDESRALELAIYGLGRHGAFRPAQANTTLQLAAIARKSARPRVVTALLSDFSARFPDHPQRGVAALLCATLAIQKTNELELARQQLALLAQIPTLSNDPRVARLNATLDTP